MIEAQELGKAELHLREAYKIFGHNQPAEATGAQQQSAPRSLIQCLREQGKEIQAEELETELLTIEWPSRAQTSSIETSADSPPSPVGP